MDAKTATAKHAPGPWDYFVGNANGRGLIRIEQSGTGQHIASMQRGAVSGANARLIAAAPDLLAALEELADAFKGDDGLERAMNIGLDSEILAARAAIAKAKVPA